MPDIVIWLCFLLGVACLIYAALGAWRDARRRTDLAGVLLPEPEAPAAPGPEAPAAPGPGAPAAPGPGAPAAPAVSSVAATVIGPPDDRIAALVIAFLFALLGVAATAVDHKVGISAKATAAEVVSLDLSTSDDEHAAFRRIAHVHSGPLDHDLCLVRFYEKARGPVGSWWTDCGAGRSIETIGEARRKLALRNDWGPYDARAEYTVPKGTDVMYLQGTVASQCVTGARQGCRRYRGGGQQYFFPAGLDPKGAIRRMRCATHPSRTYGRCYR